MAETATTKIKPAYIWAASLLILVALVIFFRSYWKKKNAKKAAETAAATSNPPAATTNVGGQIVSTTPTADANVKGVSLSVNSAGQTVGTPVYTPPVFTPIGNINTGTVLDGNSNTGASVTSDGKIIDFPNYYYTGGAFPVGKLSFPYIMYRAIGGYTDDRSIEMAFTPKGSVYSIQNAIDGFNKKGASNVRAAVIAAGHISPVNASNIPI